MCNRARNRGEPEALFARFGASAGWLTPKPMDNRFNPVELVPRSRAYVVREEGGRRGLDTMAWDVLGGQGPWPITNVRALGLKQWRALAAKTENRCLIPLTEFCEWEQEARDLGDGKRPIKAERWFDVTDQDVFAVAGFWQRTPKGPGFTMVTCDPNELVAPIHPKAMITILHEDAWDRWLRGSYDEVVALQQPYPADRMLVRGPVFPTRADA
jgi:putative SOS response-associated peptidase YedK